jgi:hypothetical protein
VQGIQERSALAKAMSAISNTYEGGRHLSTAMAGMPEICDFSIFGFAPSLRPDVLIINNAAQAIDHTVLESMPDNGIVLINADDPQSWDMFARARGAGIRNILTFGAAIDADARLVSSIEAGNGVHYTLNILGQEIMLHAPGKITETGSWLAGMVLTKLSDMALHPCAHAMAQAICPAAQTSGQQSINAISLLGAAASQTQEAIFRVKNMVDIGGMRRTMVLDRAADKSAGELHVTPKDFGVPKQLADLNIVCASKKISIFKNARKAVQGLFAAKQFHKIVPDVLAPGDYLVFKSAQNQTHAVFSEALRVKP